MGNYKIKKISTSSGLTEINFVDYTNILVSKSGGTFTGTISAPLFSGNGSLLSGVTTDPHTHNSNDIIDFSSATLNISQKKYSNFVVVNNLNDLPSPSGGKITLLPNTVYLFTESINIGSNYLEFSNWTVLKNIHHELTPLIYTGTGAAIRGVNVSCGMENINIIGAQQGFSFSGSGSEEIDINNCRFENCGKVGIVEQVGLFLYESVTHISNNDGIEIKSPNLSGNYGISNCAFPNSNSGSFIKCIGGSYNAINISNNNMDIPLGSIGLEIYENNISLIEKLKLQGNFLVGESTTKINGFNPLDGNIISMGNTGFYNNYSFPFINSNEMFSISSPKIGELLYNTTINELVYWDGFKWEELQSTQVFFEKKIDDFETGGVSGWTFTNDTLNGWYIGSATSNGGTKSLYISNDGGITNAYSAGYNVSHVWIDVLIPSATTNLTLQFDWKCEAELGYDWGEVHDLPTTTIPVAGSLLGTTGQIGKTYFNNQLNWITEQISLPLSEGGTTRRFVWTFKNDYSIQNNPPFAIDNIKIVYV